MSMDMEDFDETELRLGLPGRAKHHEISTTNVNGKRGFDETNVDLKLKLSSKKMEIIDSTDNMIIKNTTTTQLDKDSSAKPPASKTQVVGWPPVRSYRKNIVASQKRGTDHDSDKKVMGNAAAALVKVSMDGAPFLRKVDLNMYKSYQDLSDALAKMFTSFTTGKWEVEGTKDFMNDSKLMDLLNSSDYVPTYEDKDGDWMLVGDVPWGMFVESCKRLRIMKGTEAIGQHLGLARNARAEAEVVSTNSTKTTCSFDLDGETTKKGDKIHKMN